MSSLTTYTPTFSINRDKYHKAEGYRGLYDTETGHSVVFLESLKILRVDEGGPCGPSTFIVGKKPYKLSKAQLNFTLEYLKYAPLRKRFAARQIRKNAKDKQVGLNFVIEEIIKTDFHEFIHHFLNVNDIENTCCNIDKHQNNNNGFPKGHCWWCDFTHGMNVKVTPEPIKPNFTAVAEGLK